VTPPPFGVVAPGVAPPPPIAVSDGTSDSIGNTDPSGSAIVAAEVLVPAGLRVPLAPADAVWTASPDPPEHAAKHAARTRDPAAATARDALWAVRMGRSYGLG
jgi:hypothetical protein